MGAVYEARDAQLQRTVALKLVHAELSVSAKQRMQREAIALARLSHPNVVQIHEIGEADGQTFIAMELVRGQTLQEWVQRVPRPSQHEIVRGYLEAGEGLAAAHAAGLVHRDFKPANCMLGEDGRVRVLDFGLARAGDDDEVANGGAAFEVDAEASPMTQTGVVLGTPAYMPLEQLVGEVADARSDQFAFCVSLYEALYGERPFAAESLGELVSSLSEAKINAPPRGSAVPLGLRRALVRGLAVAPDDRWPDMAALLDELRNQVARRRRRWSAMGLAAGVVALVSALAWQAEARRKVERAHQAELAQRCSGARAQLEGVWDDARRREVEAAILATELSYAPGTWTRVEARLDAYAQDWIAAHDDACETHTIRGEQSGELMDLRMSCLHMRKLDLRATIDELARADAKRVENAVEAVGNLTGVERCADVEALQAEIPLPEDPQVAEQVEALDVRLATVRVKQLLGEYDEGLRIVDEVVAEATTLGYEPLQVRAWLLQGDLRNNAADYEGAVVALQHAYDAALARRMIGEAAGAAVGLMFVVGHRLARIDEGRRWAIDADPLTRAVGTDVARASYLDASANLAVTQGNFEAARGLQERAIPMLEKALGPDHLEVASSYNNLGNVAAFLGEFDEARGFLERALAIRLQALGPDHPEVANSYSNLGNIGFVEGKYADAGESYARALAILEQALGPDSPELAIPYNNLGAVADQQGRYDDARTAFERSLTLDEAVLGPDHPSVAYSLGHLGDVAQLQGRYDDARGLHERALAIRTRALEADHPDVASSLEALGQVEALQGNYEQARGLYERALAIFEQALGPDHLSVASSLYGLGDLAELQGDYEPALGFHERALALREKVLGPDHPTVAASLAQLGKVMLALDKPDQALPSLERALVIVTGRETDPPTFAEAHFTLARALWLDPAGHPRARELAERGLAILEATQGGAPEPIAEIRAWLVDHPAP